MSKENSHFRPAQTKDADSAKARGKRAAEIALDLRGQIISGDLPPEAKLGQESLAERYQVSRIPVREALRLLEAEGLVIFDPNKTARVAPLSKADMLEIYAMRVAAETLALKVALPELSNRQIDAAEEIQAQIEEAPLGRFGELNTAFHRCLYEPACWPRLLAHIDVLGHAADRYLRLAIAGLDYAAKSHREHHELLKACRARDEAAAVDCLTKHIGEAGEALAKLLR